MVYMPNTPYHGEYVDICVAGEGISLVCFNIGRRSGQTLYIHNKFLHTV
jgi:hypothetical protein